MHDLTLQLDDMKLEPQSDLDLLRNRAWAVGGVATVVVVAAGLLSAEKGDFLRAYLIAWLFTLGVAVGLTAINMIHHLSGGDWGVVMRRVFEASGRTLPLFLVLGLPIAFHLDAIYPWASWAAEGVLDPASPHFDPVLASKSIFLNPTVFLVASAAYILIWWILAAAIGRASSRQDSGSAEEVEARRRSMGRLSAGGLVIYVLTGTLASVHWTMSLDPHWFSSLYGAAFVVGHGLSAFAFVVPMLIFLSRRKPLAEILPAQRLTKVFHDYGKLMLAFVAVWAYFAVSQFLIIWSGDLPEEVTWYLDRASGGWQTISVLLVAGQFAVPFILLLSQDLKKKPRQLVLVAVWLLAMRWFDLYWQVAPSLGGHGSEAHFVFSWYEVVAPVGLFGLWLGLLASQMKNRALVPVREPALAEVLAHG